MKEKKKINFIDIVILICVVLIILVAVFRAQLTEYISGGKNQSSYSLAFESDPISNSYIVNILNGNTVEWMEKGLKIGTIDSLDAPVPETIHTLSSDGTLISTPSDTNSIIRGTLDIRALEKNGCFISGTEFIGAGMKLSLRTNDTVFTVTVLSIVPN